LTEIETIEIGMVIITLNGCYNGVVELWNRNSLIPAGARPRTARRDRAARDPPGPVPAGPGSYIGI